MRTRIMTNTWKPNQLVTMDERFVRVLYSCTLTIKSRQSINLNNYLRTRGGGTLYIYMDKGRERELKESKFCY